MATSKLPAILARAESRMWLDFQDGGAFKNSGDIGDAREDALRSFLSDKLPSRFKVAKGEVVDASGAQSGQIDVLIYDGSTTSPLLTEENGLILLPAEALLATVEVKSKLTTQELRKALTGIANVRKLRPNGAYWGTTKQGGEAADDGVPNFFSSIFAYSSDLEEATWTSREIRRVRRECAEADLPTQWVDRIAVLSRGVVLPAVGNVASFTQDKQVLGLWLYHLLNFLGRESMRRSPFPWNLYERSLGPQWSDELVQLNDAPAKMPVSQAQRKRYLRTGRD